MMLGEKCTIRIRMNTGDAHYAGELVNGSHMLDFFGDVATELLIRLDGDEGLFCAYDEVKFLAPVYAGDFVEYVGWFDKIGNSSRHMQFEAYKICELCREDDKAVSAARVLEKPLLIGTASGTCVTPKECQRGPQDPAFDFSK